MATSSSRIPRLLHDVFLSFRGADTRNSFTSHLFAALNRQGISTFRDDTKLRRGENISFELLKGIEESRISIVVFSRNYAASKWCLDELVKIMECRIDLNQIVLPIFYDVDPSQVRAQHGFYSEAFVEYENRVAEGRLSMERMERWMVALKEAAHLSGYHLQHGDETKLITKVVKDTVKRLDRPYLHVADHLVGIEIRKKKLKALLNLGSHDVRIVAIWGDGGIGKTTIAKVVFNCIRNDFDGSSFLANVSETSKNSLGEVTLQKQLLRDIVMTETYDLVNKDRGIEAIKQILCHRQVLLVLDDVDNVQQLKNLGIDRRMFCSGSRIIITTRNVSSISSLQVDSVYSPAYLDKDESLKLFSRNAFKLDHPRDGYWELSKEVVAYAGGLPLALEVLGSYMSGKSNDEWQSALEKLKIIPHDDIHGKLKISFDALDDRDKELFLDIAFFFIGMDKDFMVKVLEEDSECFPVIGIEELARRCLVRVDCDWIRMHDLVRGMGREIVRTESLKEPGRRSRLWHTKEILKILTHCTGTKEIEGICLGLPAENSEHVKEEAFANMSNLRLLHLNHLQHLSGTYITTSKKLKWLCWHGFPFTYISANLYMENIVAIDLQYSKLKQIWKGPKRLDKLRFLNLSHSYHLIKTPDFSGLKNLERLLLTDCTSLVKVHNSIGCLDKLLMLHMANCINLSKVPSSLFMLKSLEKLDFSGCSKLGELAESKVGFSMFRQRLTKHQKYIPISMASVLELNCLQDLNLANCNLEHVPAAITSIITLDHMDLSGNKFCSLPSSFSHLSCLSYLYLDDCVRLKSLPYLPNNLVYLTANNCKALETASSDVDHMGSERRLEFSNCPKLDGLGNDFMRKNLRHLMMFVQEGYTRNWYTYYAIFPGRELPNGIQFQGIGLNRLSFVVPPLVGNKIVGIIVSAVVSYGEIDWFDFRIENKTKGESNRLLSYILMYGGIFIDEDHVLVSCSQLGDDFQTTEFIMEGGDEADLIVWCTNDNAPKVKRLGLSLIYEDLETGIRHYPIFPFQLPSRLLLFFQACRIIVLALTPEWYCRVGPASPSLFLCVFRTLSLDIQSFPLQPTRSTLQVS